MTRPTPAALLLLTGCALAMAGCAVARPGPGSAAHDPALEAQLRSLEEPAQGPRYVFVGVALSGRSPAFYGDIRIMDRILRHHYGAAYRSVLLANRERVDDGHDLPLATRWNVDRTMRRLQAVRRPDDRFILLFTSHGARWALSDERGGPSDFDEDLSSAVLGRWVGALAPNRTWVMISACYSGSHLDQVKGAHVLAMTASDSDHASLGCGTLNRTTFFVGALARSLDFDHSVASIWDDTERRIAAWEKKLGYEGAHPQIRFGEGLSALEQEPLSAF